MLEERMTKKEKDFLNSVFKKLRMDLLPFKDEIKEAADQARINLGLPIKVKRQKISEGSLHKWSVR